MKTETELLRKTNERFLREIRHHFRGWLNKVSEDFSDKSFDRELAELKSDPVYHSFGFAIPEYVFIRLMGRVSISIGRRLGEIYDKIPRFVIQARYGLSKEDVAPLIGGKLQLDICVPKKKLAKPDLEHLEKVIAKHLTTVPCPSGLGMEIRYNFNPNDSSRLRKDEDMARLLKADGLGAVYLIFSTISPRDEAIARLTRAGWHFLVGDAASQFITELIGLDLPAIVESVEVQTEIKHEVAQIMATLFKSHATQTAMAPYIGK